MITELKETKEYLKNHGIKSAGIEAEDIFCHLLNCRIADLYISNLRLDKDKRKKISMFTKRRVSGEPLQYILQKTFFCGLEFRVKKGVFIPRPETEILVDAVLLYLNSQQPAAQSLAKRSLPEEDGSQNILDLCTGCGNIVISLTKAIPYYKMFASDISQQAIDLAKDNAQLNNVTHGIHFRCGNLFAPWMHEEELFDLIICNPPYIKSNNLISLAVEVKNEPKDALDGGADGLLFYRTIVEQAPVFLKEKGCIVFEIAPDIADAVKDILGYSFYNIEIIKDYNKLDRVIIAKKK